MESNMSFGEFWLSVLLLSFKGSLGVVRAIMFIATIALTIISSQHPDWVNWMNMLAWALPLGIFLVLFVPSIMLQAHRLYKQKADKVQEYETEAIELEEGVTFEPRRSQNGVWVAKVGVRAKGLKTIYGVSVCLTYIDGNQNERFSVPLRPYAQVRNVTGVVTVNPGNTQRFFEVLHWNLSPPEIGIPYSLTYQLKELGITPKESPDSIVDEVDVGSHDLIVYATGEGIRPIQRQFRVEIRDNKLEMHRINNEQQQER